MPQTEDAEGGKQPKNKQFSPAGFWWVVLGALIMCSVVVYLSRAFSKEAEKYAFIAQAILNILIFAAILVQALIYHRQQEIMRGQLEVMKASIRQTKRFFDLTERPSLGIEGEMEFSEGPNGEAFIVVTIKNSGKSPAVQVLSGITTGIELPNIHNPMGRCPEPEQGEMLGIESRGVIPIGGTTFLSSKTLTVEEFVQVLKGELQYVIWVYVSYCKNRRQRTPYVFESYSSYKAETGEFVVCPTHNDAT